MESIGIIGYGRFGKVLEEIFSEDFKLRIFDPFLKAEEISHYADGKTVLQSDIIIPAVPIHAFESVIQKMLPNLSSQSTVVDVCSVKTHPTNIMKKHLPPHIGSIATHPLFGPDSVHSKGSLNFMMHKINDPHHHYEELKTFFSQQFNVIEMTPEKHDQEAAKSQAIVHFIARMLEDAKIASTEIDTHGFRILLQLIENNCNDTFDLFCDLINYNPYTGAVIEELQRAFHHMRAELQKRKHPKP